jgi:nucleotide-binding universal stress UspA family protein
MPYRTIVLAYDGSEDGRRALLEGAEVAKRFRSKTHLLAVIKDDANAAMAQAYVATPPGDRTAFHQNTVRDGVQFFKSHGLEVTGHVARGDPVTEIVKLAQEVKADLVVVGHRERGLLEKWWTTPTSMSLLERIDCSLLIGMHDAGTGVRQIEKS